MISYIKSKKICSYRQNHGLAILSILILLAIVSLGIAYIIQTNSLVKNSYKIREKKEHISQLEVKNQQLTTAIAVWQSPANLEKLIESLNLVKGDEVVYLKEETTVAVKK